MILGVFARLSTTLHFSILIKILIFWAEDFKLEQRKAMPFHSQQPFSAFMMW